MTKKTGNTPNEDSIIRFFEKESMEELSPMNPPEAYSSQKIEFIPYEKMHPFLQQLMDEHKRLSSVLDKFEKALITWRTDDWIINKEIDERLKNFFEFYDETIVEHNCKEEKILFPILNQKLIESGEHSKGEIRSTAINLMEDEHIKIAQTVALVFNFLGLASRLPDKRSKEITFEAAFEQGIVIVETMKLHIFREENILFPQAMKYFTSSEFEKLD